jgi:Cu+-exporting ATPase
MGMTMTQKIMADHAGLKNVVPGQLLKVKLDMVLGNDITTPVAIKEFNKIGINKVFDVTKIAIVPDHFTPNKDIKSAEQAKCIKEFAREKGLTLDTSEEFQAISGRGIRSKIGKLQYLAGNLAFMQECGVISSAKQQGDTDDKLIHHADTFAMSGKTPLYFAEENRLMGIIAVADVVKQTSKAAIDALKQLGIDVVILTGDNKQTAEAISKGLSVNQVVAEVLPQDKESEVRKLQEKGHKVAMVGDGINDAPALARAEVGIAIGAGTDIAIEAADVVLMKSDLLDVVTAIQLSKATLRNIKENLFWAFFYNIIGIPLAAGVFYSALGWKLSPMFGAAAMSLSSVFVVSNALRLRFFKPVK